MRCQVSVVGENEESRSVILEGEASEPLSRLLWLSAGLAPQALCTGLGLCGRCRLRFLGRAVPWTGAETAVFSEEELAQGWRLSCRHTLGELQELHASPVFFLPGNCFERACATHTDSLPQRDLLLALDLGTTSVCWQLVTTNGDVQASNHFLNPQACVGSDVISRLAYAQVPVKRKQLAELVREAIVQDVSRYTRFSEIRLLCLAANTAMAEIFLDSDVRGLASAPYRLVHRGHEYLHLQKFPPVYLPPLPGPFLGSDVSAGLAEMLARDLPKPWLLVDLGTNAEFALMTDELYLASVPMGPAVEGIGMRCGQLAGEDVITAFTLGPSGLVGQCPQQSLAPSGISATGYFSLLSQLVRVKLVDASGHFLRGQAMPVLSKISAKVSPYHGVERLDLGSGLFLEARDVEELLKVKAAFATALHFLLKAAGLQARQLSKIFLAGALGEHVQPKDLETLGFFPQGLAEKIVPCGNSALMGAARLAVSMPLRDALFALCQGAHVLTLTDEADFQQSFFAAMHFGADEPQCYPYIKKL